MREVASHPAAPAGERRHEARRDPADEWDAPAVGQREREAEQRPNARVDRRIAAPAALPRHRFLLPPPREARPWPGIGGGPAVYNTGVGAPCARTTAVPIMASRVTRRASSAAPIASVPGGRRGITM